MGTIQLCKRMDIYEVMQIENVKDIKLTAKGNVHLHGVQYYYSK